MNLRNFYVYRHLRQVPTKQISNDDGEGLGPGFETSGNKSIVTRKLPFFRRKKRGNGVTKTMDANRTSSNTFQTNPTFSSASVASVATTEHQPQHETVQKVEEDDGAFVQSSNTSIVNSNKSGPNAPSGITQNNTENNGILQSSRETTTPNKLDTSNSSGLFVSPQAYLNSLMESRGYSTHVYQTQMTGYFARPTPLQQASFHPNLVRLAREGKHQELQNIMKSGISLNPCDGRGISLVNIVCHSCEPETLQLLLDVGTSVQVSDAYGRTPLHYACSRAEPCFRTIEKIAGKDLHFFHMADCRGIVPLSNVPRKHWHKWLDFIECKKDIWWKPIHGSRSSFSSQLLKRPAHSCPIENPSNALSTEAAARIVSGIYSEQENSYMKTIATSKEEGIELQITTPAATAAAIASGTRKPGDNPRSIMPPIFPCQPPKMKIAPKAA